MERNTSQDLFERLAAGPDTRRMLWTILDTLPVGVCIKDADTLHYLFRNRRSAELTGVTHAQCLGLSARDVFSEATATCCEALDREAFARGQSAVVEQRIARKDGGERLLRARKFAVAGTDGLPRLIVGVYEDIAERRQMRQVRAARAARASAADTDLERRVLALSDALLHTHELAHTHAAERLRLEDLVALRQSELERVGRINLLGEMAAGLAHEINQPLAAIIYTLTGAANRAKAGALNNAQMLEALRVAIAHGHRSAAILSRIKAMANKHTHHRGSVQINDVVAEMAELCAITALGNGVRLRCEADPRLPAVQADKVQIEQVLLNLIRNGIDAVVDAPGRRQEVTVSTAVLDESTIEVRVEDSGEGAPPERIARMFEPFFTTKEHGMGLGLAICQSIIEEHGGAVRAENRWQGGMRMSFTLKTGQ